MTTADTNKGNTAVQNGAPRKAGFFNQFDNPWLNAKFLSGAAIIGIILLGVIVGYLTWDTTQARAASSPLNLPESNRRRYSPAAFSCTRSTNSLA